MPDEQVKPAIAVVIKPPGCLSRVKAHQAGLLSHIGERAITVVSEQ